MSLVDLTGVIKFVSKQKQKETGSVAPSLVGTYSRKRKTSSSDVSESSAVKYCDSSS